MLDNLVSNHPKIESLGELAQLTSHLNKGRTGISWDWTCTCGQSMDTCPVWAHVASIYKQQYFRSLSEVDTKIKRSARTHLFHFSMLLGAFLPNDRIRRWTMSHAYHQNKLLETGRDLHRIIDAFRQTTGVEIIVDSSKTAAHLQALIVAKPHDVDLKLIHIVRDGRAVLYSKIKRSEKYKKYGASFKLFPAIFGWCYSNLQILNTRCFFRPEDIITLRYEDLCNKKESELRKICRQIGLIFDDNMVFLSSENKHNVGGTSHRFTWNADTPISLDDRYKKGLSVWRRAVFYLIAGVLHKKLGY